MKHCRATGQLPRLKLEVRAAIAVTAALLTAILSGCAWFGDEEGKTDPNLPPVTMLYSPNGEPLNGGPLGRPTCREALTRWFDRLASAPDHTITSAAFLADARTQFQRMDIDHNGYLVPEELERFRLPYRQPLPPSHRHRDEAQATDEDEGAHQGRRHVSGGTDHNPAGGHGNGCASQPDPVMSADTGLDFKVTLDAFLIQARTTFARLDANHDGHLIQAEILGVCEPKK